MKSIGAEMRRGTRSCLKVFPGIKTEYLVDENHPEGSGQPKHIVTRKCKDEQSPEKRNPF